MSVRQSAVVLACFVCTALVAAQRRQPLSQPPPQPVTQFRAGIELVRLDVSVLDRDRRPVRGLTPADFTIFENGVPQKVAAFNAVDIPDPAPPPIGWMRDVAPDVRTNEGLDERRLFLLLLDDAMIQALPLAVRNVREIAHAVIDRLGPSDLAAVVFTRDNRNSQDYTNDRARLLAAVDKFTVGFRDMGKGIDVVVGADDLYLMYSANVVESAVDVLSALPDRRKSVIYIGQGVPVDLELGGTPQQPGLPPAGGQSALSQAGLMGRLKAQMLRVFERAQRANVNVYTVDACGLRAPGGVVGVSGPMCVPGLEVEYMQTIAENTRAHAVINTNDFTPGVQAIFDENASYYLLGYQSTDTRGDGKFRRIEVRVNRPGVSDRTRSGYTAERADDAKRKATLAKSPLGAALSGVLPKSDLPLQAMAVPIPLAGRSESAVAIVVAVRQPLRPNQERHVERVDLQVSAYNVDGRHYGSKRMTADVVIRSGASGLAAYEVLSRLDLRPGRYQLRIAANVGSLSTSGSLYYDVDVPDHRGSPVMLSGVVLSAANGPVVAPRDAFKGLLPIVPTSRREFSGADRVTAFARVHRQAKAGNAPVEVTVQVVDDAGAKVINRVERIPVEAFAGDGEVDLSIELPIARLRPGTYLLTLETPGRTAPIRRDVRFVVQ